MNNRTFLTCVVIFEVGSTICAAAPNSPVLIVGRAIAGLASAGIFSGSMLIMIPMIPLHRRPMFQGIFGMVFGLASVMGPLVGGGLTGSVSWRFVTCNSRPVLCEVVLILTRWCFWINLPIGAVTLIFMFFFWNPPKQQQQAPASVFTHIKRLDPLGTLFFVPSVVCLLLALQWGGSTYAWNNWRIILMFVLFAVLAIAFAAVQIFLPETATVPGRIITQRSVAFGASFSFFLAGSMLMLVYYLPIWFQTVKGVDPLKSGIYTLPLVLSLVVSSMMSGIATQKIGYYVPSMLVSPCLMSIGEGLMSTFNSSSGPNHWIGYQFISGFGLGLGMQTAGLAVQTVLPMADISTGIAIIFFTQQLGGAIFTTVGQTLLSNLLVERISHIPGVDPYTVLNQGATDLLGVVPPQDVSLVIDAYNYACTRIFLASMGCAFAALLSALGMEFKSIKKGKQGPGAGAPGGPGTAAGPATPGGGAPGAEMTKENGLDGVSDSH